MKQQHSKHTVGGLCVGPAGALLLAMVLSSGCAHQLDVKNLNAYQNMQMIPLRKPATVGVVPAACDVDTQRLLKGIGNALQKYSATVLLPYYPGSANKADVVANIAIRPEFEGSGWNFLINWPGFLIWTPAWNGYVYKANFDIQISLTKGSDNSRIDSWSIPINLNLRHAAIDRTWTEIGWLEWSVIPFIGGLVFTQYDTDVTPILLEKIENPIGDYIAQQIITRINNSGALTYQLPIEHPISLAASPTKR